MKEWKVLPTDDRFLDLTDEQLQLMYEHWAIDNPKLKRSTAHDPDYEDQEPQSYHDPDFDKEWDEVDEDEESDSNNVGENPPLTLPEPLGEGTGDGGEVPSTSDRTQWEEV